MHERSFATYDRGAVFRVPPATTGNSEGHVDYRLARAAVLADYRDGILAPSEVCDAHPELVRAAREVGRRVDGDCPICERRRLVHVTYVFGPRLPKHGRCITLRGELTRLAKRPGTHVAYAVEVCQACSWNHLVRRSTLESPTGPAPNGSDTVTEIGELPAEAASDGE
ncbi:UNVERIFIED_CONTAM: hypothetical protein GTU68_024096 [Idotea baltica]|nr:hypothetical protein [Idotea baltica]